MTAHFLASSAADKRYYVDFYFRALIGALFYIEILWLEKSAHIMHTLMPKFATSIGIQCLAAATRLRGRINCNFA
jgi:hypothetical protein